MNTLIKTTLMSLVAMGLCSSALAEVTAVDAMLDIGYSKPADAEPIVTAKEMDDLTTEDMSKLAKELDKAGLNEKKPTGDAKYAGPVSTSKIKAIAKCDPSDGLFKMTFYVDGSATKTCLTSPGSLNHPTNLSIHGNRVRATTKLHIVSDAKSYAGAPMPNAVWIGRGKNSKGELSGFATHETGDLKNLGHPASHGCLRLNYECSKYFYDLVRRNGIDNS
ncbi:MAG: L,D-transpeptidase, partial [Bdellovibrionales bacterium]|nr:L,D-transpeptidase [Bdellovibrionales bacterium]